VQDVFLSTVDFLKLTFDSDSPVHLSWYWWLVGGHGGAVCACAHQKSLFRHAYTLVVVVMLFTVISRISDHSVLFYYSN